MIPWRRVWQPTPVFLPGEFHGQRRVVGYSSWSCKESDTTEATEHAQESMAWSNWWKKKSNKDVFINIGLCHNCIEIKSFKEYLHKWAMINSGERNGLKETELKWGLSFLYYTHLYFVYNKNIFTYYILVKSSSINPWNLCTEWEIQESTQVCFYKETSAYTCFKNNGV